MKYQYQSLFCSYQRNLKYNSSGKYNPEKIMYHGMCGESKFFSIYLLRQKINFHWIESRAILTHRLDLKSSIDDLIESLFYVSNAVNRDPVQNS